MKNFCRLFVWGVSVIVFGQNQAKAEDWPQWLGPNRNGVSTEKIEPWTEDPKVLWKMPVGNGFCCPVAANGAVYVHSAVPEKEAEEVTAFDLQTGEIKWTKSYPRANYSSQLGVGPRATPCVLGNRLVAFGITGELACFNTDDGEILWRINPYKDNDISTPGFGVCSSPLAFGDHVYVQVGGAGIAVAAYELATGKLAWKALDEPASSASPILWEQGEKEQKTQTLVVQTTLRMVGLDPKTGNIRWEHALVFQPSGVSPTPLVAKNRLICTTQNTGTMAVEIPSDPAGEAKSTWWEQELSSYFSTGTVGADGRVFIITNAVDPLPRADVRCIDAESGKEFWKQEGLGYFHAGLIATGDDKLLVLDDKGTLILADAGKSGFNELCRSKVCAGTFANPVLSDGKLIARDGKQIVCVELKADKR